MGPFRSPQPSERGSQPGRTRRPRAKLANLISCMVIAQHHDLMVWMAPERHRCVRVMGVVADTRKEPSTMQVTRQQGFGASGKGGIGPNKRPEDETRDRLPFARTVPSAIVFARKTSEGGTVVAVAPLGDQAMRTATLGTITVW